MTLKDLKFSIFEETGRNVRRMRQINRAFNSPNGYTELLRLGMDCHTVGNIRFSRFVDSLLFEHQMKHGAKR